MNEYMMAAIDLAEKNLETNDGGPFGACIVKDGKIIGKGSNNVIKNLLWRSKLCLLLFFLFLMKIWL